MNKETQLQNNHEQARNNRPVFEHTLEYKIGLAVIALGVLALGATVYGLTEIASSSNKNYEPQIYLQQFYSR